MKEDKQKICDSLLATIQLTRAGADIVDLMYLKTAYGEIVDIAYKNGGRRRVDVTADSGIAMVRDIIKEM